ncbi:MAG: FecR family protein [Pseudomonadota bacterium]
MSRLFLINTLVGLLGLCGQLYANENRALVSLIKGTVTATTPTAPKAKPLKQGDLLALGTTVKTGPASFVRINLPDKSTVSLGPSGEVTLAYLSTEKPSVLNLLKGKMRASVDKKDGNYKMFIKTKTASIGVRGTDFNVSYNPKNNITTALTYKGLVAMKLDNCLNEKCETNPDNLQQKMGKGSVRKIRPGEFSGAYLGYKNAVVPTKIAKKQFKALAANRDALFSAREDASSITTNAVAVSPQNNDSNDNPDNSDLVPRPRGEYTATDKDEDEDPKTVYVRPGGYLDVETGIYVAPPADAEYDSAEKVYTVPEEYGKVDQKTGGYIPPDGFILDPVKGFIFVKEKLMKMKNFTVEQLQKAEKLAGKLNGTLMKGLYFVKDLTGVDFSLDSALVYDTRVYQDFFGEVTDVTKKKSGLLNLNGVLGRPIINNHQWSTYFKAKMDGALTFRQYDQELNTHDYLNWYFGMEFDRKHESGRHILDLFYEMQYRDYQNDNIFKFYLHDLGLQLGEEWKWKNNQWSLLALQFLVYRSHLLDNEGNYWKATGQHKFAWGNKQSLKIKEIYSWRKQYKQRDVKISKSTLEYTHKAFLRNSHVTTALSFQLTETGNDRWLRGTEKLWTPEFMFEKWMTPNWAYDLFIQYQKEISRDKILYDFEKWRTGFNLRFII